MQKSGARNLRLVIGKRAHQSNDTRVARLGDGEGTYILDPTFNWTAHRINQIGERSYVHFTLTPAV